MHFSLTALAQAFVVVLPVELPDKTLVTTLILTTRYRPLPVFVGVSAAFATQCVIAVTFGGLLTLLPGWAVAATVAALFAVGAVILLREGFSDHDEDAPRTGRRAAGSGWRMALTCFGVLFAAEWGDASQLATAALTAHTGSPVSVGLGAFLALVTVAAIVVTVGTRVIDRIPTHLIQRVAGAVFGFFAVLAVIETVNRL